MTCRALLTRALARAPARARRAALPLPPARLPAHASRCASASCFSTASAAPASADFTDPLLGLSEEGAAYYTLAADFAAREMAPHAGEWDEKKVFPEDVLRAAAGLGFAAMYVSPEHGGTGLSRAEGTPIVEALAGACTSTAAYLTIHNMCGWMIDRFGSAAQKAAYLPRFATMDAFASYCLTEPNAGSDAASLQTRAVRAADGSGDFLLSGGKAFISGGGRSDVYIVMARTGAPGSGAGGISAFLVDAAAVAAGSGGLTFGAQERKMGWNSQPTAAVYFDAVRLPATALIGEEGAGFKYAMAGLDGGRLSIGACSVGAATTCFRLAREHVGVRKQFGRPLAAQQSVGFTLADMAADLLHARAIVRTAAGMLDAKHPAARPYCALAKRVATAKGLAVCDAALQLHGGYGYLKDYGVERFLRDARVHTILEGTNEIMNVILARSLLGGGEGKA
jgi:isobutyryl-CoA dehydrogenase